MAREPTLEESLKNVFWNQMNNVYTSIPCVVINIHNDFTEQLVDVQPSLNEFRLDKTFKERPPILRVPVIMPSTGSSSITMPIEVGDTVWCMFSMRALEKWQESDGKPSTPDNHAKYHQKDAVALIGLNPRRLAPNNQSNRTLPHSTKDLVVAHNIGTSNEVEIRFKPNGDMIVNAPNKKVQVNCGEAELNASSSTSITTPELNIDASTTNWVGDITLSGNIAQTGSQTVSGDVTASGKSLSGHTHQMPSIQSGPTTKPTLPPT